MSYDHNASLRDADPLVAHLIDRELGRQRHGLRLCGVVRVRVGRRRVLVDNDLQGVGHAGRRDEPDSAVEKADQVVKVLRTAPVARGFQHRAQDDAGVAVVIHYQNHHGPPPLGCQRGQAAPRLADGASPPHPPAKGGGRGWSKLDPTPHLAASLAPPAAKTERNAF